MKSFEVESVKEIENDTIFDIDVLPNRGSDCLSHLGIAREISVVCNLPLEESNKIPVVKEKDREEIRVTIEPGTARRFIAVALSGIDNKAKSPAWLRESLIALGERSISPVVDITNYILLVTGQPLHAYDRDKLEKLNDSRSSFHVGFAKEGETLMTLSGGIHELHPSELLIKTSGDDNGKPLGLAGLKGGKDTAADEGTARIILEAASFNGALIRKSAQSVKLHTQASKRFENEIPSELSALGILKALELFGKLFPSCKVDVLRDEYVKTPEYGTIKLSPNHAPRLLGIEIKPEDQRVFLEALNCSIEEKGSEWEVTPPWYRTDLKRAVDLVEEIGRLNDYANIESTPLNVEPEVLTPRVQTMGALRSTFLKAGYSEVITRSFRDKGEVELANPLAKNTPFLRINLTENLHDALVLNAQNAELLELEYIRIFEIGTVFTKEGEHQSLAFGIQKTKNAREKIDLKAERLKIEQVVVTNTAINLADLNPVITEGDGLLIVEYTLNDALLDKGVKTFLPRNVSSFNTFKEFSVYPYALRDVSLWTPGTEITPETVEEIIREVLGKELQTVTLFDQFQKEVDGKLKTSYAFRLVFQSFEKTLSDEEVNFEMRALEKALLRHKGFEIR